MRIAVTAAVLLAVIATAVVAVCQQSETRHLQYRVWQIERRHERLERQRRRLEAAIEATRTPRRLLSEPDAQAGWNPALDPEIGAVPAVRTRSEPRRTRIPEDAVPAGFDPGDNFEGLDR